MNESEQAQAIAIIRHRVNNWKNHLELNSIELPIATLDCLALLEIVDSQAQKIAASATVIDEMHAHTVTLNALYLQAENKIAEQAKEIERLKAIESELESVKRMSSGVAGYHLNGEIATWEEVGL